MNITDKYNPSQGLMIISTIGSQKYTEMLDSYSQVFSSLRVSDYNKNNKYCIDSCWESGNIYYANYDTGYVKKIQYDGTEIASISLTNPSMVSVIQNAARMNSSVTYPPQDDQGCWVTELGTNTVIKTNKNLNIVAHLHSITSPVCIKSDIDGGCYIIDTAAGGTLIKVSANAVIEATLTFAAFVPAITTFIDMSIDASGFVWVCANDTLYNFEYTGGAIVQRFAAIYPLGADDPFSSSSSEVFPTEPQHVGAIDVDRYDPYNSLYVTGGNSYEAFVLKYTSGGYLLAHKQYSNITFPYIVKVIQGMGSTGLYLLEDSSKWDTYGYGSSSSSSFSSSSSYVENWSSSSTLSSSSSSYGYSSVSSATSSSSSS